jgi:4-hydroxy-3-methylbut-2-enyl diphosphate reductase
MIVVGGYNSSNTRNLARMCTAKLPTYHIADAESLTSFEEIHHRPVTGPLSNLSQSRDKQEVSAQNWLPGTGEVNIGLTAGASTPNNIIGRVVLRLEELTRDQIST